MSSSTLLFLHVVGAILLFSTYIAAFTIVRSPDPVTGRSWPTSTG